MFVAGGNHQMKGVYISLPIKINAQLIKNEKSFNSFIKKQNCSHAEQPPWNKDECYVCDNNVYICK